MAHNPSTFAGESGQSGFDWSDMATLHSRSTGSGLLHGFKALRKGTMAELVGYVGALPEAERDQYMIEKPGDRQYQPHEIAALYHRPDYPGVGGA
jgi:hypothetical protein